MKNVTWKLRALLLTAAVLVFGAVCLSYGDNPSALVGQWIFVYEDGHYCKSKIFANGRGEKIELFGDGTGVANNDYSVTWKVTNQRLALLNPMHGVAVDYKVSGYELILICDDDYGSAIFVRKEHLKEYEKKREAQLEAERKIADAQRETERKIAAEQKRQDEALMAEQKKREAEQLAEQKRKEEEQRKKEVEKNTVYFTDSRDNQKYRAVKISGKTWFAQNLNYQPPKGKSWCCGNDNSNCNKYGRLYDWKTATTACPAGWRLPTRSDWGNLVEAVGGKEVAGAALKSKAEWEKSGGGTDAFGFTALPAGGLRPPNDPGCPAVLGKIGVWWTADKDNDSWGQSYMQAIAAEANAIVGMSGTNSVGNSVRCVQD